MGDYFQSSQTRTLASWAPLGVVAGTAGLIIGAAVATPVFAAAGLGLALTSVAANIASSLVYDLIKPDLDAGDRERKITEGLKKRDSGVIRLVAEALTGARPDVARAIPDPTRAELIAALGQGMQAPGGALAAIAPSYTSALSNPPADWTVLQAELKDAASRGTHAFAEATHKGATRRMSVSLSGPVSSMPGNLVLSRGGGLAPSTT